MNTVLIVGATGVIGEAALAHFAMADNWNAIGLSRRTPEPICDPASFSHIPLDLLDAAATREACNSLNDVTHVIYAAVAEQAGLVSGWHDTQQMQTNLTMLNNLLEPLSKSATNLQHVSLLQGAKAYGAHAGHITPVPARENASRVQHKNFYWLQEDYLQEVSERTGLSWTIFRPQVVVGSTSGVAMNPLLAFAAYAAIRKEEGKPFSFPGGVLQLAEIVDAGLIAEALEWAATAQPAKAQTFNITNGDVCAWRELWPTLAMEFDIELGPDEAMPLATYLLKRNLLWQHIAKRNNLKNNNLKNFLGESHYYADILLRANSQSIQHPILLSTIKLRQAGFSACRDSESVIIKLISEMKDRRLIPKN
jgi:nucleoside-diphosphate-sugar epimerase